jgi:hypothetical protein
VAPHQQENTHISMEREMRTMNWVQGFSMLKRIISAAKRVYFVSDRLSYIMLRSRWFHINVPNVHATTKTKQTLWPLARKQTVLTERLSLAVKF